MPKHDLFTLTGSYSRFWVPALLDNLARVPPTFCDADGCSILLCAEGRLHLAATTREPLRARLFDERVSYSTRPEDHRTAYKKFKEHDIVDENCGLTGWAVAFNRPLNLRNIRDQSELSKYSTTEIPPPVWSDRARGFYDFSGPRPFLVVPMRYKNEAWGAVRVYKLQSTASAFSESSVNRLLEFASHLAEFLHSRNLLQSDIGHFFRIASAPTADRLAKRITAAVPLLFNVDTCSLFLRSPGGRFVLRNAGASAALSEEERDHFSRFLAGSQGRLHYVASEQSKTGLCIKRQAVLELFRSEKGDWQVAGEELSPTFDRECGAEGISSDLPTCELAQEKSNGILLVPVRDSVNPRLIAGVLRVVSRERQLPTQTRSEILNFAALLSTRLSEAFMREARRLATQTLIQQVVGLPKERERLNRAATIIAEALEADAVTIFTRAADGGLVTNPRLSYLNRGQITFDRESSKADEEVEHYRKFQEAIPNIRYAEGLGRTGSVVKTKRVLNLKDIEDARELSLAGVTKHYASTGESCEIQEPGPFLAAPVLGGRGQGTVRYVVRALRWKASPRGPFSGTHEDIIETCAGILGALPAVGTLPRLQVVLSYEWGRFREKDVLVEFLRCLEVDSLLLEKKVERPMERFEEYLAMADCGIVIATPDQSGRGVKGPSQSVLAEMQRMREKLGERVVVLQHREVRLSEMLAPETLEKIEFGEDVGLEQTFGKLAALLSKWRGL